jgi:hypothetical protein
MDNKCKLGTGQDVEIEIIIDHLGPDRISLCRGMGLR